jgi:hypothetical protein
MLRMQSTRLDDEIALGNSENYFGDVDDEVGGKGYVCVGMGDIFSAGDMGMG